MSNSTIQAFLSYAHADAEYDPLLLEWLGTRLESEIKGQFSNLKFSIWRDAHLRTGDRWDPKIEAAVRASHIFIVPLSANWLASEYCLNELETFLQVEPDLPENATTLCAIQFATIRETATLPEKQAHALTELKSRQVKFGPGGKVFGRLDNFARETLLHEFADDIAGIIERLREPQDPTPLGSQRKKLPRPPTRSEFTANARDFSEFDVVTTAFISIRRNKSGAARLMAQFDFLPKVFVRAGKARIEFGVRRAYLDIERKDNSALRRSEHISRTPSSSMYVSRHNEKGSVTLELNPHPH